MIFIVFSGSFFYFKCKTQDFSRDLKKPVITITGGGGDDQQTSALSNLLKI